jgi:acetyl-CoA C-acetyltransferase
MTDVVITHAVRTPIGKFGGSLAKIPAPELGATVIKALLRQVRREARADLRSDPRAGLTAGSGQNPARQAVIKAGLPTSTPR